MKRVRAIDDLKNISYVYQRNEGEPVRCVLSNGIPASLFYAGIHGDEAGIGFEMETAKDSEAMAALLRKLGSPRYTYEAAT